MKKSLIFISLFSILLFNACTNSKKISTKNSQDITIFSVKENEKNLNFSNNKIALSNLSMSLNVLENSFYVKITNTSNKVIFVDWAKSRYIGLDNEAQKIFDISQTQVGILGKQTTLIKPNNSFEGKFVPFNNLLVTKNDSVTEFIEPIIWGRTPLFEKELKNKTRNYSELIIPISFDGYNGKMNDFIFIIGDKQHKSSVPNSEISPKTNKINVVSEENQILMDQIKQKENLIKILKEKEQLKLELELKEKEIKKLMGN